MFLDELTLDLEAGRGGSGCTSFRREKYVPNGGPNGGDGGDGGSIIFRVDPRLSTLHDLRYRSPIKGGRGMHGQGKNRKGMRGGDAIVRVPPGTMIRTPEGVLIADLVEADADLVFLKGGRGGRGNQHFATPRNQAPRRADPGEEGGQARVKLELKLLADIGLVGFPNAGKSTLLARLSAARPKISDYPFTTLQPHLGIVQWGDYNSFVLADLPGLIAGAHEGKGLGHRFLRHVERTRNLLFVLDCTSETLKEDLDTLRNELAQFEPDLLKRPAAIAFSKADLLAPGTSFEHPFPPQAGPYFLISAVTGQGLDRLVPALGQAASEHRQEAISD
ncbi:MAG: GTPase ObgE [Candidatus Latescibacteria bacterium]|nr:GTPase ObgE [Candidatus Latescibacterota bacterium]